MREQGLTYAQFMGGCAKAGIEIDRKIMADLAMNNASAFAVIVESAKKSLGESKQAELKKAA